MPVDYGSEKIEGLFFKTNEEKYIEISNIFDGDIIEDENITVKKKKKMVKRNLILFQLLS